MRILNRTALVVRPKRRLVEWVNSLDLDGVTLSLDEARSNASIYLVRVAALDETSQIIDEYALEVFEEELWGWSNDQDNWPRNRTAHVFRDWFDVQHVDLVEDLEETPLEDDEDIELDEAMLAALTHCAWCDRTLGIEDERVSLGLTHPDPDALIEFEGHVVPMPLSEPDHAPVAIVANVESEAWAKGEHLLFTMCGEECAEELKAAFERERARRRS